MQIIPAFAKLMVSPRHWVAARHISSSAKLGVLALATLAVAGSAFAMNQARSKSRVTFAFAKYGVTGKDVIVAILDRGIDWKNADFQNPDGTTRIEYIFDLSDNSGANAPGNTFGVGTIYTKAQIDNALATNGTLNTRDAVGHGTTTTAIAAGGGRNDPAYRGIAPNARIIAVKVTSEGAPAHGSQPAEAAFYNPAHVPIAIDFVVSKAAELGLPVVMLANFGRISGPADGSSELARKIDSTVGPGKPGIVFVTGSSDDGQDLDNHAGGTVVQGQTTSLQIAKVSTGNMRLDLWYSETDRFDIRIITPGGTYGPFPAPAGPGNTGFQNVGGFTYYHRGRDTDFQNSNNQQRQVLIDFTGAAGTYQVDLIGATVSDGRFDAVLSPATYAGATPVHHFLNHVVTGTIWDMASAQNNICPNSYINWRTYTDINGVERTVYTEEVGDLWLGSGVGPTWDGRQGIDVSAPGDGVITTYNPTSHWSTFAFNTVASHAGMYGRAGAVSAAAPQVVGIIALMLESDPTLDAAEVKQILRQSAKADSFTGAVPNNRWGYGKVDALAALDLVNTVPPPSGRLINVSTRAFAGSEDSTLIVGFYIDGVGYKTLIIRGIGPELLEYGVPSVVEDPSLVVYSGDLPIRSNDDWDSSLAADFAAVGAFALPVGSKDAALKVTLPAGGYTVHLVNPGPVAEALIEVYDLSRDEGTKLGNLSCRLNVSAGQTIIIGTALLGPSTPVIFRGVGPGLAQYIPAGTMLDPHLRVYFGSTVIGENDNWDVSLAPYFGVIGAFGFELGSKDAAVRIPLTQGGTTVHTTPVGPGGIALVELYKSP